MRPDQQHSASETEPLFTDGGPAFPTPMSRGMSLRDYFAGQALSSMYANEWLVKKASDDWDVNGGQRPFCPAEWFSGMAYEAADAMLEARK